MKVSWRVAKVNGVIHIVNHNGGSVATTDYPLSAEFIVRACNAHDELVAALRSLITAWNSVSPDVSVPDEINNDVLWENASAALAEATKD